MTKTGTTMQLATELQTILAEERVTVNETLLAQHSSDESYHTAHLPDVVVYPNTAEEISAVMTCAEAYDMPIVPFGYGSSLEASVIPKQGGIVIDFANMNKILEVMEDDFLVKVQPGVTRSQLEKELKKYGLFFTVDPGADATIGGMAATNASGTTSVKYGIMRDKVRDLEVVMPNGSVIHTGSLAAKSSSGYHLNGLFVGSEGTLGCFSELTLQVTGIPEHILAGRAEFASVDDAVNAVIAIMQSGLPIARVELVDEEAIAQMNLYSETDYTEVPTLFLELHGNEAGLQQDVQFMESIVYDMHCRQIEFETDTAGRNRLWEARHNVAYAFIHNHPGRKHMATDVCVPISELAGAIKDARTAISDSGLPGGIIGHVGDGNYHISLMLNPNDQDDIARADKLNERIVSYALECGGTCTGEHGVGTGKRKYQKREHGKALQVMQRIKHALDPHDRMNPGKVIE